MYSRIPLNDDAQEKAKRMQSRHALHDIHMNQIKAAASPMRKLSKNYERAGSASPSSNPKTPRRAGGKGNDLDDDVITVGGTAVTPMKRVPLLANFEEWMKMATDNKINAANSWNFALIDYFHDMSLLKEGDGVNFQKASCTLDGCVKIYTSRVDSVATETGKLLSGLADSGNNKKKRGENDEEDESEEEVEDEDGVVRKKPKKRVSSDFVPLSPTLHGLENSGWVVHERNWAVSLAAKLRNKVLRREAGCHISVTLSDVFEM
jgi:condensin complex subunit 2